ncbi:MAG: tetratricopeptide repeat protein [Acidobacteriota bacterium]
MYGYTKTGSLLRIQGDYDASLKAYGDALGITRELAQSDASSLDIKRDVGSWLTEIAIIRALKGDFEGCRQAAEESAASLRVLMAADATDVASQQYLANALNVLGDALSAKADYAGARRAFDEALKLNHALLAKISDSTDIQNGLSGSQLAIGKMLNRQGDRAGALKSLQQSLEARKRLATADPGNPALRRGVAEVMHELAAAPGSPVDWDAFRSYVKDMDGKGQLWPSDRSWLEEPPRQGASGGAQ